MPVRATTPPPWMLEDTGDSPTTVGADTYVTVAAAVSSAVRKATPLLDTDTSTSPGGALGNGQSTVVGDTHVPGTGGAKPMRQLRPWDATKFLPDTRTKPPLAAASRTTDGDTECTSAGWKNRKVSSVLATPTASLSVRPSDPGVGSTSVSATVTRTVGDVSDLGAGAVRHCTRPSSTMVAVVACLAFQRHHHEA